MKKGKETNNFFKEHDFVENIIHFGLTIVTSIFTGKLLAIIFKLDTLDTWVLVICLAVLFTLLEIRMVKLYRWTGNAWYLAYGCLIGIISIGGSLGYFQVKLEQSVMESTAYQAKLSEMNGYKVNAERYAKIGYTTMSNTTWSRYFIAQKDLKKIKDKGSGLGSSPYRIYATLFGIGLTKSAILLNLFIAIIIEIGVFVTSYRSAIKKPPPASEPQVVYASQPQVQFTTSSILPQVIPVNASKKNAIIAQYKEQVAQGKVNKSAIAMQVGCSRQNVQQVIKANKEKTFGFGD